MKIDEDEEYCLDLQVSLVVLSALESPDPLGFLGSRIQHHNLTDCKSTEAGPCSLLLCFSNPAIQLSRACTSNPKLQPTLYVAISANSSAVACPSLLCNFLCGQCPLDAELAAGSGVQTVAAQALAGMPLQLLLNYLGQGYKVVLVGQFFGGLVAHTLAARLLLQVQQEITMARQMGINLSALSQTKDKVVSFGFGTPLFAGSDLQRCLSEAQLDHNLHSFWHAGDGSVPFLTFASELAVAEQHSNGYVDTGVEEDSGAHDGYLGSGPALSVLPQLALGPGTPIIALDQFATALGQAMEPLLKARKIPALVCSATEGALHSAALASHLLLQKPSEPLSNLESLDSPSRPQHNIRPYHTESQVNLSPLSSGANALPLPPRISQDRRSPAGVQLDKRTSYFRRSISKDCELPPLNTGRATTRVSSDMKRRESSNTSGPLPKIGLPSSVAVTPSHGQPPFGNDTQRPTPLKLALGIGMVGRAHNTGSRREHESILSPPMRQRVSSGESQIEQVCQSPASRGNGAGASADDNAVAQLCSALSSFLKLVPSKLSHHAPIGRFWIIERASDAQQGEKSPKRSPSKAEGAAARKGPGPAPTKSPGILSKVPKVPKGRSAAKAPTSDHAVQAGVEEPLVRLVQVPGAEALDVATQWLSTSDTEQLLYSWELSLAELERDLMEVFPW
eukprot:CAMPEP_0202384140 /NCGR_PEP_ID=MMETSP1127-20130417/53615_1 /ASSEMBLY_ACC=CAM_ASM_000462 /TAXON_ID=3047 /ORGANISM="Dunaliella tertiolecta, Strain CCMP1320" /LENGTH=677 /DNA_ID=CAMNT_0048983859 /DNA_START=53 /DNA_END=2083 /DNA_ORIENTATION=-